MFSAHIFLFPGAASFKLQEKCEFATSCETVIDEDEFAGNISFGATVYLKSLKLGK